MVLGGQTKKYCYNLGLFGGGYQYRNTVLMLMLVDIVINLQNLCYKGQTLMSKLLF